MCYLPLECFTVHGANCSRHVVLCRGAFKIRGASNSIFALDDNQASKGVVTHSRLILISEFLGGLFQHLKKLRY
jgi:hypothetical protein